MVNIIFICKKCEGEYESIGEDELCKKCHKAKLKHEYYVRNKEKCLEKGKKWRQDNIERIKERDLEYHRRNKELRNQQAKEYYEKNRDKIRAQREEFHKNNPDNRKEQQKKRREIPEVKLEMTLRRRARRCLIHGKRCMEYLGCSIDFLKEWFKFQFNLIDENMTLENHGTYWEIDHVKPVSSFDLTIEDDIKQCFHWTNVSPLEKSLNKKKSYIYTQEMLDKHKERVNMFLEHCNKNNLFNINETLDTARL
jgi:hypothetical protein